MNIYEFYDLLLPADGVKFAVTINNKVPTHHAVNTIQELVDKTVELEQGNGEVYFGCAAYDKPEYVDPKDGKRKKRTQDNAIAAKAFWWDIDCGEKKEYPDQATALITLAGFCAAAQIPTPMQVSSGNGVHCYWPLTEPISKDKWEKIARLLHSIAVHHGFKTDPTRSRDIASILRPIDTYNKKDKASPKLVEVLVECAPLPPDDFTRGLLRQVGRNNSGPVSTSSKTARNLPATTSINADLCGGSSRQYPTSSAEVIVLHCAQLAHFKQTGSDNEPHWRQCAGALKFTTEGEPLYHAWSSKHPDYDQNECQTKLDGWKVDAPATCESFNDYMGACKKCKHHGKITTPNQLGYTVEAVMEAGPTIESQIHEEGRPVLDIPKMHGYRLDEMNRLCAVTESRDGQVQEVPFCDVLFYLYARFRELDGTMSVGVNARIRQRDDGAWEWKKFTIPTSVIGEKGRALRSELAKYEIVCLPGRDKFLENYMQAYLDMIRKRTEEINAYRNFGTQDDGSILIGTTLYSPDGTNKEVMIGVQNTSSFLGAFKTPATASTDAWIKCVSEAYNHPDHEQYQFLTYVSLGSMLVDACGINMGGLVNLYGEKGTGKSTAGEIALSIWGDRHALTTKWGKEGTTMNALFAKASALHSIPFMIDELTTITAEEATSLAYQLLSGKTKEVLTQTRSRVIPPTPWRLHVLANSNASLMDTMSTAKDDASAELTRALEIHWRKDVQTIDKNDMTRILYHMDKHHGTVGRVFAQMVAQNSASYREEVLRMQQHLDKILGFAKEQRFWSVIMATSITAGKIATKAGLLPFELKPIVDYAITQARRNMGVATDCVFTPLDSFHRMVTFYSPFTINTEKEGDSRHDRMPVLINGEPLARVVREDGVMYLSLAAIREWCKKRQIGFTAMKDEVVAGGLMVHDDVKFYLGKGTDRQTGQVRCWKLDWNKLQGL